MRRNKSGINRRDFLKRSAALGLGFAAGPFLPRIVAAASRERITILNSSVTDALNPYNHSSSPIYGMWQHIIEPLVEMDYSRKEFVGVLAESWEFQGKRWVFHLRKGIHFHNGAPFTSKDVIFSINRIRTDKFSLQRENFKDVVEMQAPDDHTVILMTKQVTGILLDRIENRFILSKASADKYGDQMDQNPVGTGPYKFVS